MQRKALETMKVVMQCILEAEEGLMTISEDVQHAEQHAVVQEVSLFAMHETSTSIKQIDCGWLMPKSGADSSRGGTHSGRRR